MNLLCREFLLQFGNKFVLYTTVFYPGAPWPRRRPLVLSFIQNWAECVSADLRIVSRHLPPREAQGCVLCLWPKVFVHDLDGILRPWCSHLYHLNQGSPETKTYTNFVPVYFWYFDQYFGYLMWRAVSLEKILMLGKIEGKRRRGRRRMRWLDSITDSIGMNLNKL